MNGVRSIVRVGPASIRDRKESACGVWTGVAGLGGAREREESAWEMKEESWLVVVNELMMSPAGSGGVAAVIARPRVWDVSLSVSLDWSRNIHTFTDHPRQAELQPIPSMDEPMDKTRMVAVQHVALGGVVRRGEDELGYHLSRAQGSDLFVEEGEVVLIVPVQRTA